jgi:hypothetical protein
MMISWWSKHVGVILSVLMCDICINALLHASALVGPLQIGATSVCCCFWRWQLTKILGVVSQIRHVMCTYRRPDTKYPNSVLALYTSYALRATYTWVRMRFPVEIIARNYFFCKLFLCLLTCQTIRFVLHSEWVFFFLFTIWRDGDWLQSVRAHRFVVLKHSKRPYILSHERFLKYL